MSERMSSEPHLTEAEVNHLYDVEISDAENEAVEVHLRGCPDCAALWTEVFNARMATEDPPPPLAPGQVEAMVDKLNARAAADAQLRRKAKLYRVWALVAAALLALAALAAEFLPHIESVGPEVYAAPHPDQPLDAGQ